MYLCVCLLGGQIGRGEQNNNHIRNIIGKTLGPTSMAEFYTFGLYVLLAASCCCPSSRTLGAIINSFIVNI